jgi:hypothetical protein
MNDNIFDDHAAYSRYLSIEGMRPSEMTTRPSLYISDCKMKRAFKTLSDDEIKLLFKNLKAGYLGLRNYREKLEETLVDLLEWQTFYALYILLRDGNYDCAKYVLACRWNDVCPFKDETDIHRLINQKW